MMEHIEQLKSMREQAQKRVGQKRDAIKKQMYALTTSADAQLIKSLNPLIENLEQSLANTVKTKKIDVAEFVAEKNVQARIDLLENTQSNEIKQNAMPTNEQALDQADKPAQQAMDSPEKIQENSLGDFLEQTAENALERALNESSSANSLGATLASVASLPSAEINQELTPAQQTQLELEKIAAQLRETISQGRSI